tara:strand:- start:3193 stop:4245 length:1053 start_codon:yes stop_codon:yes gene_type:complete
VFGNQRNRGGDAAVLALLFAVLVAGCDPGSSFAPGFSTDPDFRREHFLQPQPRDVDVLWVIDTSCSMLDEQEALATNGPNFFEFFIESDVPFHIGSTSTNVDEEDTDGLDGRLAGDPGFLTAETPNLADAFLERTLLGIDPGHNWEKGLQAAWKALEYLGESDNAGFLRDEANLSIIVVSDEPDFSETAAGQHESLIQWEDFVDWLDGFKGEDREQETQLSAVVGISEAGVDDPEGCNLHPDPERWGEGALRGDGYLEAAMATGGSYQSICTENWATVLSRMGLTSAGLSDTFLLDEQPAIGTLEVEVNGQRENRWLYKGDINAIYFTELSAIPRSGEQVTVRYRVARPL